jgi:hypothetical protein
MAYIHTYTHTHIQRNQTLQLEQQQTAWQKERETLLAQLGRYRKNFMDLYAK